MLSIPEDESSRIEEAHHERSTYAVARGEARGRIVYWRKRNS
jgi:hypothetical protein